MHVIQSHAFLCLVGRQLRQASLHGALLSWPCCSFSRSFSLRMASNSTAKRTPSNLVFHTPSGFPRPSRPARKPRKPSHRRKERTVICLAAVCMLGEAAAAVAAASSDNGLLIISGSPDHRLEKERRARFLLEALGAGAAPVAPISSHVTCLDTSRTIMSLSWR